MRANRKFERNGKIYTSIIDIAREEGVKRIFPQQFEKYGIKEITEVDEKPVTVEEKVTEAAPVEVPEEDKKEVVEVVKETSTEIVEDVAAPAEDVTAEAAEDSKQIDKPVKSNKKKVGTQREIKEVQSQVANMSLEEFYSYIKFFSVNALVKMADVAGINNWDSIQNDSIRRMHLMADIKQFYFPGQKLPEKKKSQWVGFSLEELIEIADKNKVEYKKFEDKRIQRMRVAMALDKAGIVNTPEVADGD